MAEETIFTWGAPPLKCAPGAADEVGFAVAGLAAPRTDDAVAGIPTRSVENW